MHANRQIVIGIDGGGTNCRAHICLANGKCLGVGHAGSANIMSDISLACTNIMLACTRACKQAQLPIASLAKASAFIGIAGANIGNKAQEIIALLPFANCQVTTDVHIALRGAIGNSDGVIAVIGTGSIFALRAGVHVSTFGGWGFTIGDQASGARIGRDLLEKTLLAYDGIIPTTPLVNRILHDFKNNPHAIVEYAHNATPAQFGAFAPLVVKYVRTNDASALAIWQSAVTSVNTTLHSIIGEQNLALCLLGGLGEQYMHYVENTFKKMLVPAQGTPVDGAIHLALEHFVNQEISSTSK